MGIAPCVVLSASSHIILSSRARHSTRVTRSSPVRFHLTRNTTDRQWIRRGYTVFRFRRNGFKDPSVYRREPLSLRSEPPPRRTRLTLSRSRWISRSCTSASPQSLCFATYRCICSFLFPLRMKDRCFWGVVAKGAGGGSLKRPVGLKRCYSQRPLPRGSE